MTRTMRTYLGAQLAELPHTQRLAPRLREEMRVVAALLPFKLNDYVLDELIDWSAVPDDPIFRLTFPDRRMLPDHIFEAVAALLRDGAAQPALRAAASAWRRELNPHPSGQATHNVPELDGVPVPGLQHKYAETVLVFPSQGQTCHTYCGYCFRWAQFVGEPELVFKNSSPAEVTAYLRRHPEVSDVLLTGGDPLVMSTPVLRRWIEPLLAPELEHITTIRIGTKALAYWPFRITEGPDGDDLLRLFEQCAAAGRTVAAMLHVSHPRELETAPARAALARLRSAGVTLRAQAPLVRHVNDAAGTWAELWRRMVALGIAPYYLFVERNTGANAFFKVPLAQALRTYREAQSVVSGLARTARGPVMSALPGKIIVDGEAVVGGERVFLLRLLQAREAALVGQPFFARYSEEAAWIDDLQPALAPAWPWEDPAAATSVLASHALTLGAYS